MRQLLLTFWVFLLALPGLAAEPEVLIGPPDCRVVNDNPQSFERIRWSGPCKDGYATGEGQLEWLVAGKLSDVFEGRLEYGKMVQGYLRALIGKEGESQYEGTFKHGRRDGSGIWVSSRDDRYQGSLKEGKFDGTGQITYGLGGGFAGEWAEGRPVGKGRVSYPGGRFTENIAFQDCCIGPGPAVSKATKRHKLDTGDDDSFARRLLSPVLSVIPFDKSYGEMTPAEQAAVRSPYPVLHHDDHPPYPVNGTAKIITLMREAQQHVMLDGVLSVRVVVGDNGRASAVTVFHSPSPEMTAFITRIMEAQEFHAGHMCRRSVCDELSVRARVRYPLPLTLAIIVTRGSGLTLGHEHSRSNYSAEHYRC